MFPVYTARNVATASGWRRFVGLPSRVGTRPVRFLLVGLTGVGVSTGVLWVGRHGLGLPTVAAGLLSGVISTFTNFQLNDVFTWRELRSRTAREKAFRMLRYYSTTAMGAVISLGVLVGLTDWLGVYLLLANLIAIGVGGTFNYLIHNVWTWRRGERK